MVGSTATALSEWAWEAPSLVVLGDSFLEIPSEAPSLGCLGEIRIMVELGCGPLDLLPTLATTHSNCIKDVLLLMSRKTSCFTRHSPLRKRSSLRPPYSNGPISLTRPHLKVVLREEA